MSSPRPFYESLAFDCCNLTLQAAHFILYFPLAVMAFKQLTLEVFAKVVTICFLLVFLVRTAIGAMIVSEYIIEENTLLRVVLDVMVSVAGSIIYIALYYMVFEMFAAKIILNSLTFETFKKDIRRLKIIKAFILIMVTLVQIIIVVIVEIKSEKIAH